MNGRSYILQALVLLFTLQAEAQGTLSIFECYGRAGANFPVARQKEYQAELSRLKMANISNDWLPSVDLNAQATYQSDVTKINISLPNGISPDIPAPDKDQYKATLDVSQMIYDGGMIKAQKQIEDASLRAGLKSVEVELYGLRERINQMYFYILLLNENIGQLQLVQNDLTERLKTVNSGIENGILMASNADVIQVEILKNKQQITGLESDRESAYKILSELTGTEISITTQLELPQVEDSVSKSRIRPEHELFELRKSQLEATQLVSDGKRMPKLVGFAQLGYGKPGLNIMNNELDPYYIVGAKLSWKIWDWKETKNEKQMVAVQSNLVDNQRETFDKNMAIARDREQAKINKLNQMLESDKQIIALRAKIRERSASQLQNGIITSTDYITDLNAEAFANINFKTHQVQLAEAYVNLLNLNGK